MNNKSKHSNKVAPVTPPNVSIEDFHLPGLVDMVELKQLLDNFCNSVGIAAAIIDLNGEVLIASRWQRICTDFHRINKTTCTRCIESDTDLALRLKAGEHFSVYKCKNGMTDAASPIIIEGKHLANVFVGQFLLAEPDSEFFERQALEVGFNPQTYLNALGEAPVISEEKLPAILGFLSDFAKLVASTGLQRLRAERANAELSMHQKILEQLVTTRTHELILANEHLKNEIDVRKQAEQNAQFRNDALERLASGAPCSDVFESIIRGVENLSPGSLCSILLLDKEGRHLGDGVAPSLPDFYNAAINGVEIGIGVGSCGTAAFTGERVIVEDITTHPYWVPYKELAASAGLGACWSQPIRSSTGQVLGTFAIYHHEATLPDEFDISIIEQSGRLVSIAIEHKQSKASLLESESKLRGLFELSPLGIALTDMNGRYIEFNESFRKMCGYPVDELKSLDYWTLTPQKYLADEAQQLESLECSGHYGPYEKEYIRKDGTSIPVQLSGMQLTGNDGEKYIWSIVQDISERKQHELELQLVAHFDALTGIPNRILLADRMKQAIAQTSRENTMMAVCYLDLDGFKPINDEFGHSVGDLVLVEIAKRIGDTIRGRDTNARLGGDEFVVLLLGLEKGEECVATLERLLAAISAPIAVKDQFVSVSASIGVSIYPIDDEDPDTLLRHADQAMYMAKESGKNRFYIYDYELDKRARDQNTFLKTIRHGLENNQFELYYQPKVILSSGRLMGAEALIRWRHPERGLLPPSEFLRDIENTELDIMLGEWVTGAALSQMNHWREVGLDIEVSINISGYHLESAGFTEKLQQKLAAYPDMPHGNLQIEVLETVALNDIVIVGKIIESCSALGVRFALDDFGTGYSSLTYLSHLPVDTLKIDQSFIRDMLEDKGDKAIIQGIIALAKAFERRTVAEGIETKEHYQALLELGCELGQGYGIARPMPADQLIEWSSKYIPLNT